MSYRVLVVVDMQNDFVTGSLGTPEAQEIVPKVKQVIEEGNFDQIIFTMDTHGNEYLGSQEWRFLPVKHCMLASKGWRIVDELDEYTKNLNAMKIPKNAFGKYNLHEYFNEFPTEIVLVGLCTDICVISNALILKACCPESKMTIISDATAGTTPEAKEAALTVARSCQIYVE